MKKLSSVAISGGLIVDQATTLSGVVNIGGIGTGAYTSVLVRNSSNQMFHRTYSDFLNDISGSLNISGYLPLTGGTLTGGLIGTTGSFSSNGGSNTFTINHTSGGGLGLSITKGGNNEALYINKTSGSGNAVTIVGTLNATTIVKNGGTSSQYLMADGSVSTLTNPVTGTGTTNYVPKFTSGSAIGNSQIFDNGTNVGIGTTSPGATLNVGGAGSLHFTETGLGSMILKGASGSARGLFEIHNGNSTTKLVVQSYTGGSEVGTLTNTPLGFFTNSTFRLFITSAGNVGIGTTSPIYKLQVAGSTYVNGGTLFLDTDQFLKWGNSNQGIKAVNDSNMSFYAGGSEKITLTAAGNVGIGTISPATLLHINNGSASANSFRIENSDGYGQITTDSNVLTYDAQQHLFNNRARSSEYMRIDSSGRVGIGTSSPNYKLDVNGVSRFNGTTISGQIGSNPAAIVIEEDQFIFTNDGSSANPRKLIGKSSDIISIGEAGTSLIAGISLLPGSSGPIRFYTGGTEYVRFDGVNQRVGIGTTSPQSKLDLSSGLGAGSGLSFGTTLSELRRSTDGLNIELTHWGNLSMIIDADNNDAGSRYFNIMSNGIGSSTATELFRVTESGNVGIGTTSPATTLHVNGDARITSDFTAQGDTITLLNENSGNKNINIRKRFDGSSYINWIRSSNTDAYIGVDESENFLIGYASSGLNRPLIFTSNNSEVIRFDLQGRVGIGTTSPNAILDVNKPTIGEYAYFGSGSTRQLILSSYNTVSDHAGHKINASSGNGEITLATNSIAAITIDNSQNVGIGTTSPDSQLEVYYENAGDTGAQIKLGSGDIGYETTITNYRRTTGSTFEVASYDDTILGYSRATDKTWLGIGSNVGIGTASPADKFHVVASSGNYQVGGDVSGNIYHKSETGEHRFRANGSTTNAFTIGNNLISALKTTYFSGNVGIGTTSPTSVLHVNGVNNTAPLRIQAGDNANYYFSGNSTSGYAVDFLINDTAFYIGHNSAVRDFTFKTNSIDRVTIKGGGNVGIGTTSPGQKLHVAGAIYSTAFVYGEAHLAFTEFRVRNNENYRLGTNGTDFRLNSVNDITFSTTTSYTERLRITSAGNVGIGTTSPTAKLDVNGEIFASSNVQISAAGLAGKYYIRRPSDGSASTYFGYTSADNADFGIYNGSGGGNIKFNSNNGIFQFNNIATGELVRITSSGNVGIGTTSPTQKLDVNGSINIGSGIIYIGQNTIDGSSDNLKISADSSNISGASTIEFLVDGSEKARIDNNGNVGIGTTSPNVPLEIKGADIATTSTTTATSVLRLVRDVTDASYPLRKNSAVDFMLSRQQTVNNNLPYTRLDIRLAGTTDSSTPSLDVMSLLHNGNVGIGTTSPTGKLQVSSTSTGNDGKAIFSLSSNGYGQIQLGNPGGAEASITFIGNVSTFGTAPASTDGDSAVWVVGPSIWGGGSDSFGIGNRSYYTTNGTTGRIISILSTGNVGIGTTSPYSNVTLQYTGNNVAGTYFGNLVLNATTANTWNRLRFDRNGVARFGVALSYEDKFVISNLYTNGSTVDPDDSAFVILQNSNVGIGTTSPSKKLHVVGDSYIQASGTGQTLLLGRSSGQPTIKADSSNSGHMIIDSHSNYMSLNHYVGQNIVMVNGGGNVGIGTTSPGHKLHVAGTVMAEGINVFKNTTSGIVNTFENYTGYVINRIYADYNNDGNVVEYQERIGADGNFSSIGNFSNHTLYLRTNNSNAVTILGSGNVGIGTTSPNYKLDVRSVTTDPVAFFGFSQTSSSSNGLIKLNSGRIPQGGSDFTGESGIIFGHSGGTGGVNFDGQGGYIKSIRLNTYAASNQSDSALVFATSNDNTDTERMRITNDGNVGIGTTSPGRTLDVAGGFRINEGDNFTDLDIKSDRSSGNIGGINFVNASDAIKGQVYGHTDGSVKIASGGTSVAMTILDGGNVGIGTASPSEKLTVNGSALVSNLYLGGNSFTRLSSDGSGEVGINYNNSATTTYGLSVYNGATSRVFGVKRATGDVYISGNLGIGTTSPGAKLDVSGNARITSTLDVTGNIATAANITANGYIGSNTSQTRDKLRVWNSSEYAIGMKAGYTFGPLQNNYAMSFQMNDQNERGFWWGDTGHTDAQGAMALSTRGFLTVAEKIRVGYGQSDTADNPTGALDVSGDAVISGNVGIGTTSPSEKLDVVGNIKLSGIQYVETSNSASITPSAGDWIDIAELSYGEHHGRIALEWNSLYAPSSSHHGWTEFEVGTYYSSSYNYGQDTYLELVKAIAHNNFWLDAVRAVDYGSTVRIQVQAGAAVSQGTFKSYVLNKKQGTVNALTPAINANSYTVLALANIGTVDGEEVQKAIGNHTRFSSDVAFDEKVGIGTTSPSSKLHVVETSNSGTTYPLIVNNYNNQAGDGWGAGIKFSTSDPSGGGNEGLKYSSIEAFDVNNYGSSSGLSFTVSNIYSKNTAMVINRYGGVGIGTISPSTTLDVNGVITATGGNSTNWNTAYSWGNHAGQYLPITGGTVGGAVTINGPLVVNGAITENSSIKLKENVKESEGNLDKVLNLRPVEYNKIGSQNKELGLIAEEVSEVYPEFVQYDENGDPIGVHYSRLTAALIGAVKELNEQIQELKKNNG